MKETTTLTGFSDGSGTSHLSYGQVGSDFGTDAATDGGKTVTLTATASQDPGTAPTCMLVNVGSSADGGDVSGPIALADDGKPPSATPTASPTATVSPTATPTASPTATPTPKPTHHKKHKKKKKHCTKKQRKHHKKGCRKK